MKIAVIPARGGSKRIPGKNIKPFHGKPMIAWSIAAARDSACFDRILVSTDDEGIATVAQEWGAEVPFIRPPELADDRAGTLPVIRHAVDWLNATGSSPTSVCCLYATAPFVLPADLQRGLHLLRQNNCDYVFSVASFPSTIARAIRIRPDGRVEMLQPDKFNVRSQDLEEAYHDAGQFYWGRADAWMQEAAVFTPRSVPIVVPRHRVQDIDTLEDWVRAEWLFGAMRDQV